MIGSPTTGSSGFGTFVVNGRRRVPSPPAITTARIRYAPAATGCRASTSRVWRMYSQPLYR